MLYLLFVLTFLCGILFYGMSPHDKKLDMTTHQAEGMIVTFLAQHQAAKDYLYTWLGASNDATTGNLQSSVYENFLKAENTSPDDTPLFNFEEMMPTSIHNDMCDANQGKPGQSSCMHDDTQHPGFVSRVICTNEAGTLTAPCEKRYVITYGGWENGYERPNWWPDEGQKMRRYESWRKAIAHRTRGSIGCGTLAWTGTGSVNSNDWCIDNGERLKDPSGKCVKKVPSAVISQLYTDYSSHYDPLHDMLFCISEFKQGLGNYVSGATYFYDGLANTGFGQYKGNGETNTWVNLVTPGTNDISTKQKICKENVPPYKNYPCFTVETFVYPSTIKELVTPIPVTGDSYTITILAQASNSIDLFVGQASGNDKVIFKKDQEAGSFKINNNGTDEEVSPINRIEGLISWTFVAKTCEDDATQKCLYLYENAYKQKKVQKPVFDLESTLKMVTDKADGGRIYGIRYYGSALTDEEIQRNFKTDQKRFGIGDFHNGMTKEEWDALYP